MNTKSSQSPDAPTQIDDDVFRIRLTGFGGVPARPGPRIGASSRDARAARDATYINEKVSSKNIQRYQLREIDRNLGRFDRGCYWTRNRKKKSYLRHIGSDWRAPQRQHFHFYARGVLVPITLDAEAQRVRGGPGSTVWSLPPDHGQATIWLPDELEEFRDEVIADLKAALTAFKDDGFFSVTATHVAEFLF